MMFGVRWLGVLLVLGCGEVCLAQNEPASLPLHLRTPDQRVLLVMGWEELETAIKVCREQKIEYEVADSFDKDRIDYSRFFAIVAGSNQMDYFQEKENRVPTAFNHLEKFVDDGGHLFLFGTFNGRNCENLRRFGIVTGYVHAGEFRPNAGRADVLFHGSEDLVPGDHKAKSSGHFRVMADYVTILHRAEGSNRPDDPLLATLRHKLGRVTYTQVQPRWQNDLWLVTVVMRWIARGAPTTLEQLSEQVVYDKRTYESLLKQLPPQSSEEELAAAEAKLRERFMVDSAQTSPQEQVSLAVQLRIFADSERDLTTKYAALRLSAKLFLSAGQFSDAVAALNQSATLYKFNRQTALRELLETVPQDQLDAASAAELSRVSLNLAEDAADVHAYEETLKFLNIALRAATSAGQTHYRTLSTTGIQRVEPLVREFHSVLAEVEELRRQPDVPQAMSRLGRFYTLTVDDWDLGLPYLKDGPAGPLRELAEKELALPTSPRDCERLGDQWMDFSAGLSATERQVAERRVVYWYQRGLENATGADRVALRNKLSKFPATPCEIHLSLELEGAAELEITAEQLHWIQISEEQPKSIEVDGQTWALQSTTVLLNRGATRFLPEGVDFRSARVKKIQGRGLATLKSASADRAVVRLSDLPRGADNYRIAIEFR